MISFRFSFFLILGILYIQMGIQLHTGEAQDHQRIAILELNNQAAKHISRGEIKYLSNEIRRIAGYLPPNRYLVMTKENMEQMIPPDKTLEECEGSCEVETGQLLAADWIMTGDITQFGSSLRVSLRLHNTKTAAFVKGENAAGKSVEDLEKPIQRAALSLILSISKEFKATLITKAGVDLHDQLECLFNPGQCMKEKRVHKSIEESNQVESKKKPNLKREYDPDKNPVEAFFEDRQEMEHEREVREEWEMITEKTKGLKKRNKRKIMRGIMEIKTLIAKYKKHQRGNPIEDEMRITLDYLEGLLGTNREQRMKIKGVEMIRIPGGRFRMGSESGAMDEKPIHDVQLTSFYMSKTEITVAQYRKCMTAGVCSQPHWDDHLCYVYTKGRWKRGRLPKRFRRNRHPIVCIDWHQARTFARWMGGDLPSESQWEYAARGGKGDQYIYAGSNQLDQVGWYKDNTHRKGTRPVGKKKSNDYGLYDMSGNVWEWVLDKKENYANTPRDGRPQCMNRLCTGSDKRLFRGGSWDVKASRTRVAFRREGKSSILFDDLGFRVVIPVP